jgi:hypothetical protein
MNNMPPEMTGPAKAERAKAEEMSMINSHRYDARP